MFRISGLDFSNYAVQFDKRIRGTTKPLVMFHGDEN